MSELKDLIEVAKKGAVLGHPRCPANIIMDNDGHFRYPGDSKLLLWDVFLDNRWTIATPHPGACTKCDGIGWELKGPHNGYSSDWSNHIECPRCHGTGNVPTITPDSPEWLEDKEPETIEVRVMRKGGIAWKMNFTI